MSAKDKQVGGGHYKDMPIQPIDFITKNNLPFIEGCIVKYISRWRSKGGVQDLRKVIHYAELLIEAEEEAEKRGHMEREDRERLAVKLGHPMTGDRLTTSAEQAVRDFVKAHPEALRGEIVNFCAKVQPENPGRECNCPAKPPGEPAPWCLCPPDESQEDASQAQAEAAVYDRGNPHHYQLTPGLTLPADLPDGTVVEGPASAMQWVRLGVMHRGVLVRDVPAG